MTKFTIFLMIITSCYNFGVIAQILEDENCETLQSEIHITKGTVS